MPVIQSQIDLNSAAARANREGHLKLLAGLREVEARVRANSAKSAKKFAERGQILPRDRVDLLLDRGTPFLELATLAGFKMHDDDGVENASGGGVIAGIGVVAAGTSSSRRATPASKAAPQHPWASTRACALRLSRSRTSCR